MDILGASGETNVQGEQQQKLDAIANDIFLDAFAYGQLVPAVVTEEMELAAYLPENEVNGKYVVFVDPLDGSSNLDVNGGVGSIFSVRRIQGGGAFTSEDDLIARVSQQQVAAGYFVFGPSTMLVYTCGTASGVQGFTLDPGIGEYLLSHPDIRIPAQGIYYAANEGNVNEWEAGPREFVKWLQTKDAPSGRPYGTRYSGALVSDVHRILLKGGVYFYPATHRRPRDCGSVRGRAARHGARGSGRSRVERHAEDPRRSDPAQPPAHPALHRRHCRDRGDRELRARPGGVICLIRYSPGVTHPGRDAPEK
jgi:fructose-1,6-bisphosphatase I